MLEYITKLERDIEKNKVNLPGMVFFMFGL